MSDSETIELAALGRPFQLGMLYDCRRDVLIPGITLWDSEMLQKHINVRPQPNTDFKIIASDSSEAKSEALNVSASLEASFLGGLVSVKGSAEFLHDKKTSKRQSRVSLQYRATTRFEQLTMNHLGAGNVKYCNVLQEGSATHVVTALLYGAQAFFVFDQEVSSGENHQDIQGNLQVTIKKIPQMSIEGQANLKMSEEEQREANKFNCTFHGDFALENNPVTFEDAIKVYAGLPSRLGENGEHAVPMTAWLYPLKNLDSAAAQLVRQISVSLVRRAQRLLDGLDNTDVQCQDMMKEDMAIKFPELKAKLNKFRDLCSEYKLVFQKGLCKVLPNIRGGGMEEEELIKMLNSKESSPFQNDLMITYLDDREREMNDIMKEEKEDYELVLENYLLEESKSDFSLIPYNPNAAGKTAAEKWFRSGEFELPSKPGVPTIKSLEHDCVHLQVNPPNLGFTSVESYQVLYQAEQADSEWTEVKSDSTTNQVTISRLDPYKKYRFSCKAVCRPGVSLSSDWTEYFRTRPCSPPGPPTEKRIESGSLIPNPKTSKSTGAKSEEFLKKSQKVEKGNPSIHWLNLEQKLGGNEHFDHYTFGRKVEQVNNKVILLLGATGAGKTTLVNVMINYILGVKWEDYYRFKLIHEVTNRSQAECQTVVVTSYELYNQPGFQIPYSLTIIDTPGFRDTRGMAHDKLLIQMLKDFLCHPLGIDYIDAVCFVVQASLVRLSPSQRYIFGSILSIFGKDVAENILMLVTFVDGKNIPVLEAIKAVNLPCKKDKKGLPIHFKFNSSFLFSKETESSSEEDDTDDDHKAQCPEQWRSTSKEIKKFFQALESIESKDLTLTKKVLEERELLEKIMTCLTPWITAGLSKLSEIKSLKQCLENEDENMKQNMDFETKVTVLQLKRSKLSQDFVTNCKVCNFTCHIWSFLPNEDDIKSCAVMDDDGNCTICPGKCSSSDHDREKVLLTYDTKNEKKTVQGMKDNFMKAWGKSMETKEMLEKLEDEFHRIKDALMNLIKKSSDCLKRLNDVALKPSSLSTMEYIEIIIRTEEDERKPGFEDRIVELKKMKKESTILGKIAKGEDVLPNEREFLKDKEDRRQGVPK
ncbi:uncharacterized protein LOC129869110 [Salvelinus fontinalis]|uniref:uncharacterized protein LOC129869110 n=1 Tax=Salvelinus fontinalis TaxID=8038 RepID=UPI0024862882|nr:uncharacterized protein LOC129869110 [Salvelinus fontinalis]